MKYASLRITGLFFYMNLKHERASLLRCRYCAGMRYTVTEYGANCTGIDPEFT